MVAACWLGVTGVGSEGPLPVRAAARDRITALHAAGVEQHDVEVVEQLRRERAELVRHVVDTRDTGAAGVDDERPDAGRRLLRRVTRHRNGDGRAVRMRVVQRDDEGTALRIAVARGPDHGSHGRYGGGRRGRAARGRRSAVVGLGLSRRRAALRATGRHHGSGQDEEEERCSPRPHRAKRCTCLSCHDVTGRPHRACARTLARAGPVSPAERRALAARLARAFPPSSGWAEFSAGLSSASPSGQQPGGPLRCVDTH